MICTCNMPASSQPRRVTPNISGNLHKPQAAWRGIAAGHCGGALGAIGHRPLLPQCPLPTAHTGAHELGAGLFVPPWRAGRAGASKSAVKVLHTRPFSSSTHFFCSSSRSSQTSSITFPSSSSQTSSQLPSSFDVQLQCHFARVYHARTFPNTFLRISSKQQTPLPETPSEASPFSAFRCHTHLFDNNPFPKVTPQRPSLCPSKILRPLVRLQHSQRIPVSSHGSRLACLLCLEGLDFYPPT